MTSLTCDGRRRLINDSKMIHQSLPLLHFDVYEDELHHYVRTERLSSHEAAVLESRAHISNLKKKERLHKHLKITGWIFFIIISLPEVADERAA